MEVQKWYDRVPAGENKQQHDYVAEPVCMRYERSDEAKECRKDYEAHKITHGFHEMSELQPRPDGKTNTLSTVSKDNPICEPVCVQEQVYGRKVQADGTYDRRYEARTDSKSGSCTVTMRQESVAEPVCVASRGRYSDTGNRSKKSNGVVEQYYEVRDGEKTNALTTVSKDNMVAEPIRVGCMPSPNGEIKGSQANRVYSLDGKAVNQVANGGGLDAKTGLYAVPVNDTSDGKSKTLRATCYKDTVRNIAGNDIDKKTGVAEPVCDTVHVVKYCNDKNMEHLMRPFGSKAKIVSKDTPKSNTLMAAMGMGGGNGIYCAENPYESCYAQPCEWDSDGIPTKAMSGADGKQYTVYRVENGQITIKEKQYPIKLVDGYYIIRKLTVNECKRLQTVPDWYDFSCVSNTQAYKMLGNGWTCDVITHLICSCFN